MVWDTVSSWSCFCWLYRASPSFTAKNIINLVLDQFGFGPLCRVFSCFIEGACLLWPVCSLGKTVSLFPASFCSPRPNLPVTPGISWLPTFAFQALIMKRTSFLDCKESKWKGHLFWTSRRSNQSILKEISPEYSFRKDWCWSWNSSTLATWCEELTH